MAEIVKMIERMPINETEREQAILDATAELLLRHGYAKLTVGDVAEAVDLHRGLIYLRFPSKDDLVDATVLRELDRYAGAWREQLEADPQGGSLPSVYRAMMRALKAMPLASAIVARDAQVFGRYLRKPGSAFERLGHIGTREFLRLLQDSGGIRRDVDVSAVAFILDALGPALRQVLEPDREPRDEPSAEAVVETLAHILDRALTPPDADPAAGKALLLTGLDEVRARFSRGGEPR